MSRFAILLGGDVEPTLRLRAQVAGARVIAADGGMRHAKSLFVTVETWVGDFDSSPAELHQRHKDVPRQTHPTDKDKTDGDLAVDLALASGADELVLAGALGGATDHALAHLGLLLRLALQGIAVFGSSGVEEAYPLVPGTLSPDAPHGSRLSIIPLTSLTGLTLTGVYWPLQAVDVPLGSTWTVSNAVTGPVRITLAGGSAIVIVTLPQDQ